MSANMESAKTQRSVTMTEIEAHAELAAVGEFCEQMWRKWSGGQERGNERRRYGQ